MVATKTTLLSDIHLSKDIAELEDDVRLVWEPPDIYQEVFKDNIWLIYGRKGSGKSHLVDYLEKDKSNGKISDRVIIIRPREDRLFPTVMTAISEVENADERIVVENVASALEFMIFTFLMRRSIDIEGFLVDGPDRKAITNFLINNQLDNGDILGRVVNVLSRITGGSFKLVDNLSLLISDNPQTGGFYDAKVALWRCLKHATTSFLICIDDIDEIGFSFSRADRLFVNALIVTMLRANLEFARGKHPLRVLLTSPSELFFHSTLWGDDWVETKSRCLRWTQHEAIQRIVNKRIGQQLNIKKSNPRNIYDIYSDAPEHTWSRLFPTTIVNKIGRQESAVKYMLRHTFYTPRHFLDLSDKILHYVGEKGITVEQAPSMHTSDWNNAFQIKVEEYSCNVVSSFLKLYGKIYEGLEDVLQAFNSKPAIWTRGSLCSFVDNKGICITRREPRKEYKGNSLIERLQYLGFIGLGSKDLVCAPLTMAFNMRWAFLERLPSTRPWEIAAVSPVFYDSYGIYPPGQTIVTPHEQLILTHQAWQEIGQYVP